jgi:transketolase
MRNAFIDELVRQARVDERVTLVVGDLGYSVVEPFADEFPKRFFNSGVAEQNMMGLAAGMASEGRHVYVYSIANFPTFRCAEQIRNDVDYHKLPVTVVTVGGGLAYGALGYSHHAVQDYGLMRMMPNMLIASPGDPLEVRACMAYLAANPQPSYLRLGKAGEAHVHKDTPPVEPGCWTPVSVSSGAPRRRAIVATGAALANAWQWVNAGRIDEYDVYSLPLWGMASKPAQAEQVRRYEWLTTVEDHLVDCGFGSWMQEALMGEPSLLPRVAIKALDSRVAGMVAQQKTLNEAGGLGDLS